LGRWLEREFPREGELFLYFHQQTRSFVIAQWTSSHHTWFWELKVLGRPDGFTLEEGLDLRWLLHRGNDPTVLGKRLIKKDSDYMRDRIDSEQIDWEKRHYRKKAMITHPGSSRPGTSVP